MNEAVFSRWINTDSGRILYKISINISQMLEKEKEELLQLFDMNKLIRMKKIKSFHISNSDKNILLKFFQDI